MYAAADGNLTKVQFLVGAKADIHVKTENRFNALYYAVAFKHKDVVDYLLAAGADPESVNGLCRTREDLYKWMQKDHKFTAFDDKFKAFIGYNLPPEIRYYCLIKYFFQDF